MLSRAAGSGRSLCGIFTHVLDSRFILLSPRLQDSFLPLKTFLSFPKNNILPLRKPTISFCKRLPFYTAKTPFSLQKTLVLTDIFFTSGSFCLYPNLFPLLSRTVLIAVSFMKFFLVTRKDTIFMLYSLLLWRLMSRRTAVDKRVV